MPRRRDMSSMGPDLEMGSLREEMVKLPWVCRVVAVERSRAAGCGSSGELMGFIFEIGFVALMVAVVRTVDELVGR